MDRFIPQATSKEVYNYKNQLLTKNSKSKGQNPISVDSEQTSIISTNFSPDRFSSPDILFNNSINHYNSIGMIDSDNTNTIDNNDNNTTVSDGSPYSNESSKITAQISSSNLYYKNHIAKSLGFSHWDTRVLKYRNENKLSPRKKKIKSNHIPQEDTPLLFNRRPNKRNQLKSHIPYRVLDAPCLRNDFYSNLISWSHTSSNILVGLGCSVYIWSSDKGAQQVLKHDFLNKRNDWVTCVSFAPKGSDKFIVGTKRGWIYLFDQRNLNSGSLSSSSSSPSPSPSSYSSSDTAISPDISTNYLNDDNQSNEIIGRFHSKSMKSITCVEWLNKNKKRNNSGSGSCSNINSNNNRKCTPFQEGFIFGEENGYINLVHIINEPVSSRIKLISRFKAQLQQVCGMSLNFDDQQIAVGGNDNSCSLWDITNHMKSPVLKYTFFHNAAIKAVSFCPWSKSLLATGGGTKDKVIKFWHTETGTLINQIKTDNQITSLIWSQHYKQIVATFGFGNLNKPLLLTLYTYPTLEPIVQVQIPHPLRALSSCISPDGSSICIATTDETIRFYELWESKEDILIKDLQENGIYGSSLIEHLEGINYPRRRTHNGRTNHLR
ncbi:Ama1p PWA37_002930 [Arxiozyma heterogenica]|uniref:Ama1p n=1 Tax=Arxiozyma heterogenica TaxID=278026 RepID=UPI002EF12EFF